VTPLTEEPTASPVLTQVVGDQLQRLFRGFQRHGAAPGTGVWHAW